MSSVRRPGSCGAAYERLPSRRAMAQTDAVMRRRGDGGSALPGGRTLPTLSQPRRVKTRAAGSGHHRQTHWGAMNDCLRDDGKPLQILPSGLSIVGRRPARARPPAALRSAFGGAALGLRRRKGGRPSLRSAATFSPRDLDAPSARSACDLQCQKARKAGGSDVTPRNQRGIDMTDTTTRAAANVKSFIFSVPKMGEDAALDLQLWPASLKTLCCNRSPQRGTALWS